MPTKRQRRTRKRTLDVSALWWAGSPPPNEPPNADSFDQYLGARHFREGSENKLWPGTHHPLVGEWDAWAAKYQEADNAE